MSTLQTFQQLFETVSKNPIQYRIECLQVAVNTHLGLYEQEADFEGVSICMLLKKIIATCNEWKDVEKVAEALEDFHNFFHLEKCLSIAKTEVFLKLAVYRGYISVGELGFLICENEHISLQSIFKNLGCQFLKEPPPPPPILF